jgi:hypothetical protein
MSAVIRMTGSWARCSPNFAMPHLQVRGLGFERNGLGWSSVVLPERDLSAPVCALIQIKARPYDF